MRTIDVSRMCTSRKKKIATPVMRWRTQDHIPSRPRYRVPERRGGLILSLDAGCGVRVPAEFSGTGNPPWLGQRSVLRTLPVYSGPAECAAKGILIYLDFKRLRRSRLISVVLMTLR